jgi:hypothetical protein
MRLTVSLVLLALIAPSATAQQPTASRPALTLRGVVTTTNDAPLARVRVAIVGVAASDPPALTDERGQFSVGLPDVQSVRLTFTKARYAVVMQEFARSELNAQKAAALRIRMSLGGAINGQVRDRSGAPVDEAVITARRSTPPDTTTQILTTTTNDLGEFRVGNLEAGAYMVSARPRAAFSASPSGPIRAPDREPEERTVNVALGSEIADLNFTVDVPAQVTDTPAPLRAGATASVRGRVVSPQGMPVAGAAVQAYDSAGRPSTAVETDARGRYAIERLDAGDYRVRAFKRGFIGSRSGQLRSAVDFLLGSSEPADAMVTLRAGQAADGIDVTMMRASAITGTILDEFGEPMQGVVVNAIELRVMAGRTRAFRVASPPTATGRSDDRGQYRLFGLPPGTYLVQAAARELLSGTSGYVPQFHPGTPIIDLATPTKLPADSTATAVDVTLQPAPVRRIRGTLFDPDGKPARTTVTLKVSERSNAIQLEPVSAFANADGTFAFNNVSPGEYVVQALATGRTGPSAVVAVARHFVAAAVTVAGDDPPPLQLQLALGATLMGRVVYEGIPEPPRLGVELQTVPADFDRSPMMSSGSTGFILAPDQTFEYRGVFGPNFLRALPKNPDWFVRSITYQGQDLSDSAFDFGSTETFRDIEVVVSPNGAGMRGRVTDDRATPVRDFAVVVFPTDRSKWTIRSRWIRTAAPNQEGTFGITGLVPGDYWVAAVDRLDGSDIAGDLQSPEVLDALAARAVRVTLSEGQSQDITLRLLRR